MLSLRNLWRRGSADSYREPGGYRPPARDQHMVACDTLMSELDFHMKELERSRVQAEQEARRIKTGVDYSWLMEYPSRPSYEMPQMERLELEELCYKIEGAECTRVIALFRQAINSRESPRPEDLPYLLRSCVRQVLDGRPTPETLTEWVSRRTHSLASLSSSLAGLRLRPSGKVVPAAAEEGESASSSGCYGDVEDIEMQLGRERLERTSRTMSMPNFMVTSEATMYTM
ncbi:retinal degeneration 3 [Plakobranchus ocellatus]|uniref:Retinal degeneration 3 n=1 Tax=Plakobranchus ocellatus TaxID=259542 RepID=A0AAV4D8Q3_9GAST|nr:retinal degeneration 3 [Plakobranchus ocellatus]